MESKKIIFTGPPGAGKTTIKKIFFEMANPLKLLENALSPTRGAESSVFKIFNSNIGIFDLAGQENENWYSSKKDLFSESNVIICVFDVNNELKTIIELLFKVFKIRKELDLHDCEIIVFLHKVDLLGTPYILSKINSIKDFFKIKLPEVKDFNIYPTSITSQYFFKTYSIVLDILTVLLKKDLIPLGEKEFQNLKRELSIILKCEPKVTYNKQDLVHKFNLSKSEVSFHLERLSYLGFAKISSENPSFFSLTDRSLYFKNGIKQGKNVVEKSKENKAIELFYTFLNLNQQTI